jgi:hypothetical protein
MKVKNFSSYLYSILVDIPFAFTVRVLTQIGELLHLSYNVVNIIVWYILLPLAWTAILDYKLHQILFAPVCFLLCTATIVYQRKQFNKFCDILFRLSQEFILAFGNYYLWSVIICLIIPLLLTLLLVLC